MRENGPVNQISQESVWRGTLTTEQRRQMEDWLSTHPEEHNRWKEEIALTRLLARLPEASAPSNLTARVLNAIDEPVSARVATVVDGNLGWLRRMGWVPRLAGVAMLVVAGLVGHHQYKLASHRQEMARSVAEVSELTTAVPSIEALQDFDAIRNLESAAVPDVELLALLQ